MPQRRSGSESDRFRSGFICNMLSPFFDSVSVGGRGSCLRGTPPPDTPPFLRSPTLGDLRAWFWRSRTQAALRRSPSPGAEVGQVLGKEKCLLLSPRLATPARPTLRGNLPGCKNLGSPSVDIPCLGVEASGLAGRPEWGRRGAKGL